MNPDHAEVAEWDAAYVIGALSPADRRRYEAHLEDCPICRAAIAELAPMTGLLSRVDPDRARSLALGEDGTHAAPAPVLREAVVRRGAAARRRRRRVRWAAVALAAAVLVVAAVAVPWALGQTQRQGEVVAFENVAGVPLTASVELDPVDWGTKIDLDCRYGEADGADVPPDGWAYALVVTGVDGSESELSTWRSWPESKAWVTAGTALGRDEIASIQIRSLTTGAVLMRASVEGD